MLPAIMRELGADGIPPTVRDAVIARAARAGPPGRRLLEAVAVVPLRVEMWLLEALAGDDFSHFGHCLASGMLVSERGRVGFRHELARMAVEEAILPARRIALHGSALRALIGSPVSAADPARLAHHAEQAGDADAGLKYAQAAAAAAASAGAHREAAAQFERALRFAEPLPPEARARLHERHSYECYLSDQPDRALTARRQALAMHRTLGDRRGEGESLCWLGRLLFFSSHDEQARQAASEAIEILRSLPPGRELAMAYSSVSHMCLLADDVPGTISWGGQAVALAERLGETEVLVHALNNVGTAEFSLGLERGRDKLARSLSLASAATLTEHVVRAYVNLGSVAADRRSYQAAADYLADGISYSADHGVDAWRWYLLAVRARTELA